MSEDEPLPTAERESPIVTYAVPFLGILLVAAGIPGAILGGYVVMQDSLGLCGDPTIEIDLVEEGGTTHPGATTLSEDDLSSAERDAIERAVDSPLGEATVRGGLENREALLDGAIVELGGEEYYVTVASLNSCLEANPLLFPIGAVAILVGIAAILTPPIYRRMAGFEERMGRDRNR